MFCKYCGVQIDEDSNYCYSCGGQLKRDFFDMYNSKEQSKKPYNKYYGKYYGTQPPQPPHHSCVKGSVSVPAGELQGFAVPKGSKYASTIKAFNDEFWKDRPDTYKNVEARVKAQADEEVETKITPSPVIEDEVDVK